MDLGNKLQSEKEKEELKNVEGRKVTEWKNLSDLEGSFTHLLASFPFPPIISISPNPALGGV